VSSAQHAPLYLGVTFERQLFQRRPAAAAHVQAQQQGLTLVLISAQLELFRPSSDAA